MGISKLTCTLKGEVPPKWSLDEDVHVCYRQALKDVGKILHHFVPLSRESLLKQQINRIFLCHFSFLPPWRVSWACESDFPQERQARDPTFYTWTSSGTCTEKMIKSKPALIPLIQIIFGTK
jgi:hypothetical protein